MNEIKRLNKRGVYGAERANKGIEYRIIERLRSKEKRKRLREGIGAEIMKKRGRKREIERGVELKALDISNV